MHPATDGTGLLELNTTHTAVELLFRRGSEHVRGTFPATPASWHPLLHLTALQGMLGAAPQRPRSTSSC